MPPHQRKGKHNNTVGDDDLEDYANGPLQFSEVGDESRSFGAGDGDRGNELVHNETTLPRTEAPIEEHIISSKAKDNHNITKDYEMITSPKSRLLELDDDPTMTMSSMSDESWVHIENESEGNAGHVDRKAYADVIKEQPTAGETAGVPAEEVVDQEETV